MWTISDQEGRATTSHSNAFWVVVCIYNTRPHNLPDKTITHQQQEKDSTSGKVKKKQLKKKNAQQLSEAWVTGAYLTRKRWNPSSKEAGMCKNVDDNDLEIIKKWQHLLWSSAYYFKLSETKRIKVRQSNLTCLQSRPFTILKHCWII